VWSDIHGATCLLAARAGRPAGGRRRGVAAALRSTDRAAGDRVITRAAAVAWPHVGAWRTAAWASPSPSPRRPRGRRPSRSRRGPRYMAPKQTFSRALCSTGDGRRGDCAASWQWRVDVMGIDHVQDQGSGSRGHRPLCKLVRISRLCMLVDARIEKIILLQLQAAKHKRSCTQLLMYVPIRHGTLNRRG